MTLKSKSSPALLDPIEHRDEYLTTVGSGRLNPEEVLAVSGCETGVLVIAAIVPRASRTGLLEQRGDWIHSFWSVALNEMPSLQGCRMGWDSMFFMAETTDLEAIQQQFRRILLSLRQSNLQSRCILSLADGTPENKGKLLYLLDEMSHDVTASGVGFRSRFSHKMIDGSDWVD